MMKTLVTAAIAVVVLAMPGKSSATGLATCESGPQSGWQSQDAVTKHLMKAGWREVRRMKPDGGCWEVYGINENGRQAEAYFHPVTLQHILTTQR
jgi:hypothetical protein